MTRLRSEFGKFKISVVRALKVTSCRVWPPLAQVESEGQWLKLRERLGCGRMSHLWGEFQRGHFCRVPRGRASG